MNENNEGVRNTRYDSFARANGWTPVGTHSYIDGFGLMATRTDLMSVPGFDDYLVAIGEGVPDRSHVFPHLATA